MGRLSFISRERDNITYLTCRETGQRFKLYPLRTQRVSGWAATECAHGHALMSAFHMKGDALNWIEEQARAKYRDKQGVI